MGCLGTWGNNRSCIWNIRSFRTSVKGSHEQRQEVHTKRGRNPSQLFLFKILKRRDDMILEIFATLFAISIGLLFLGYYAKVDTIKILGFGVIFLLGIILNGYGDNLQYKIGENMSYKYGDNFTGYHWDYDFSTIPHTPNDAYLFHTTKIDTYSTYRNNLLGFLMSTLAFLGWLSVFFDYKARRYN